MERVTPLERGRMREAKIKLDKVVGENIIRERGLRRLTREELADLLNLTVSHLGLIERGERGATPVVLKKLCDVLDVKVDYLLDEQGVAGNKRGTDGDNESPIRKKVNVLISRLDEPELDVVAGTMKGILKLRGNKDLGVALAKEELEEQKPPTRRVNFGLPPFDDLF